MTSLTVEAQQRRGLLSTTVEGGTAVECSTGQALAGALANPAVSVALLLTDISFSEADFAPYSAPVLLRHNFTIMGAYSERRLWPVLDLVDLRARVQLSPGTVLNITRLAITGHSRGAPLFQAPGMDFMASSNRTYTSIGDASLFVVWNAAIVLRACLPTRLAAESFQIWSRPAILPGAQNVSVGVPQQPGCSNSSAAAVMSRCWSSHTLLNDVAVDGGDIDAYGKPVPNGYIISLVQAEILCPAVLSDACIARLGVLGCFKSTLGALQDATGGPPAARVVAPPSGMQAAPLPLPEVAGDNRWPRLLAPLLGGLLGGALLALLVAAALVLRRRHLRATAEAELPYKGLESAAVGIGVGASPEPPAHPSKGPKALAGRAGPGRGAAAASAVRAALLFGGADAGRAGAAPRLSHSTWEHVSEAKETPGDSGPLQALPAAADLSLVAVTPGTPLAGDIDMDVRLGPPGCPASVTLLPTLLGKGSAGRVVLGLYRGEHVAVKLLNAGLADVAPVSAPASTPSAAAAVVRSAAAEAAVPPGAASLVPSAAAREADLPSERLPLMPAAAALPSELQSGVCASLTAAPSAATTAAAQPAVARSGTPPVVAALVSHAPAAAVTVTPVPALSPPEAASGAALDGGAMAVADAGGSAEGTEATEAVAGRGQQAAAGGAGAAAGGRAGAAATSAEGSLQAAARSSLGQEVEVLGRCRHPNVVRLLAASLAPPDVFLVMELMETSLDRVMYGRGGGPEGQLLPLPTVLHIATQVAQALSYLHPTVLHRDLKPANVLISRLHSSQPVVKLADFGLARLRNTVLVTVNPEVGTSPYMAPEAFDLANYTITDRADMYSLGVILWELLSGRRPWADRTNLQIAYGVAVKHERLPLRPLSAARCPARLRALIRACWDPVPARRPAAAEAAKQLALVQQDLALAFRNSRLRN